MQQQYYPSIILGIAKLFPLHNFMDRRFVPPIELSNNIFFSLSSQELTTSFWHICIASITILALWGHLWCTIRVSWIQHCDTATADPDLITRMGTKPVLSWTKGWVTSWVGQSEMAWDFFTLLRMACHLKLMDFFFLFKFLELSTWCLWTTVGGGEKEIREKGELLYKKEKFLARRA